MLEVIATAFFMAWAIGANDSAKAVGTAVGSGIIGFKRAVLVIWIFVTMGAVLGGFGVSNTVAGLAYGMDWPEIALVLFSAASAVTLASLWGNPISTTQAIIGALVGASLALGLPVNWGVVTKIVLTWVISPALAGLFSIGIYRIYKRVLNRIKHLKTLELTQKWLAFVAAAYASFNLGMNELANVVGLAGGGPLTRVFLALSLGLGALTFSYEVMMTVGRDLAPLGPTSGFSAQMGASLAVTLANLFGIPVSSGQAIVGAISGVSVYKGEPVNKKALRGILRGWVTAPLGAGLLAFVLVGLFSGL
ncbi:sodium:phosphate symporter [Thermococcus guaymasensis DSM 11113]|uniref:Sodium:phosphate symporter n=1 Tax=Thermococcus guaymasensis DSM 11113 TaxID=1432656 RepID=A0A0X1KLQ6_9EURY|nr:inorganic phosphate transporter [Thermococcus guaymasensis]AJC72192.1 sodium:phosphate symporter [Thermococcus guaymasensis DSM 11113]